MPVTANGFPINSTTKFVAIDLDAVNGVALGSPTSWGTAPSGTVLGVNAELFAGSVALTAQAGGQLNSAIYAGTTAITATGSSLNANITNTVPVTLTSTTITGTVAVTQSTSPWVVAGGLTHNSAAPTSNNVGALTAVASSSAPTYTAGDQVLLSVDLSGNLRTTSTGGGGGTQYNNGTTPTPPIVGTAALGVDASGEVHVHNTDTYGNLETTPAIPTTSQLSSVVINTSTSGNQQIIAGSSGKTIRIFEVDLQVSNLGSNTSTAITFQDGASTAITGPYFAQNGWSWGRANNGDPAFICSTTGAGSGFVINTSNAAQLSGYVKYIQS
jgi:hypothetical protein